LLFDFPDGEEHALGRHRRIETNREFVIGDTAIPLILDKPIPSIQR
jgi:hypothetical protein